MGHRFSKTNDEKTIEFLNNILFEPGISNIILDYKHDLEIKYCIFCLNLSDFLCNNCYLIKGDIVCIKCCKTNIYNIF